MQNSPATAIAGIVAVTITLLTLPTPARAGAVLIDSPGHLKCYRAKSSLALAAIVDIDTEQYGLAEGCTLFKPSKFCVSAVKRVLEAKVGAGKSAQPVEPVEIPAIPTVGDFICYKLKCKGDPTEQDGQAAQDQFGSHLLTKFKTSELCVPAQKVFPGGTCADEEITHFVEDCGSADTTDCGAHWTYAIGESGGAIPTDCVLGVNGLGNEVCVANTGGNRCSPSCTTDDDCPGDTTDFSCTVGGCNTDAGLCYAQYAPTNSPCVTQGTGKPGQCNAWGACIADCTPAPETCDGLDNDCDGGIDEDSTCTSCVTSSDCGATLQQCSVSVCVANTCTTTGKAPGSSCVVQVAGEESPGVCNGGRGSGSCVGSGVPCSSYPTVLSSCLVRQTDRKGQCTVTAAPGGSCNAGGQQGTCNVFGVCVSTGGDPGDSCSSSSTCAWSGSCGESFCNGATCESFPLASGTECLTHGGDTGRCDGGGNCAANRRAAVNAIGITVRPSFGEYR